MIGPLDRRLLERWIGWTPPPRRAGSAQSPAVEKWRRSRRYRQLLKSGGEGGIRTLDRFPYTPLAGARLQPLGHLSQPRKIPRFSIPGEEYAMAPTRVAGCRAEPPVQDPTRLWDANPNAKRAEAAALCTREPRRRSCRPVKGGGERGMWRRRRNVAEREGFEPSRGLHPWRFSRPLPSTARPPLRAGNRRAEESRAHACGSTGNSISRVRLLRDPLIAPE